MIYADRIFKNICYVRVTNTQCDHCNVVNIRWDCIDILSIRRFSTYFCKDNYLRYELGIVLTLYVTHPNFSLSCLLARPHYSKNFDLLKRKTFLHFLFHV